MTERATGGPLAGVRVIELAGIGPAPFAGMMLADMGAEVIRVDRAAQTLTGRDFAASHQILDRGRRSIAVDLKKSAGAALVLDLIRGADVLVEGFRPGVAERLGLGPDVCLAANPRLVYTRVTGWGQDGPRASAAGHDINYISLAGALEPIAAPGGGPPVAPLNLLGDFGAGGMIAAFGIVTALYSIQRGGPGQVIDAAIVDGTALLMAMMHAMQAAGDWSAPRGGNLFDGGAPYYGVYPTSDGRWISVGAIEPRFFELLIRGVGLQDVIDVADQNNEADWPRQKDLLERAFRARSREHWTAAFDGVDACVTPVLAPAEAASDPHLAARQAFEPREGILHPRPAPRFRGTTGSRVGLAPAVGQDTREILAELGRTATEVGLLFDEAVVAEQPGKHAQG